MQLRRDKLRRERVRSTVQAAQVSCHIVNFRKLQPFEVKVSFFMYIFPQVVRLFDMSSGIYVCF